MRKEWRKRRRKRGRVGYIEGREGIKKGRGREKGGKGRSVCIIIIAL